MNIKSNKLPGLSKYPDLQLKARAELSKAGCCNRQSILRKYQKELHKREQRNVIESTTVAPAAIRQHRLI